MRLLLIAYKIEKDKGSEDGTGYHIAGLLGEKLQEITLITRGNNIPKLKDLPSATVNNLKAGLPKPVTIKPKPIKNNATDGEMVTTTGAVKVEKNLSVTTLNKIPNNTLNTDIIRANINPLLKNRIDPNNISIAVRCN